MSSREHLVILGGNDGGLSTVLAVRRCNDNRPITVVEKNDFLGHAHCDLPYAAGQMDVKKADLIHRDPEKFAEKYDVNFLLETEAVRVQTARKTVLCRRKNGQTAELEYGKLVLATGAEPVVPPSFTAADEIFTINRVDEIEELNSSLRKTEPVFIIGGGVVGVETADSLSEKGYTVGVIEGERLMLPFSRDFSRLVAEELTAAGVKLFEGQMVKDIQKNHGRFQITTDSAQFSAGTVIAALGTRPLTDYLNDPSFNLDSSGAVPVDNRMRTGVQGIYAVGDIILRPQFDNSRASWPVASAASLDGWIAGLDIAGRGQDRAKGVKKLGLALTNRSIARIGMMPSDLPTTSVWLESTTKVRFYQKWREVYSRIAIDKTTGQLLAGEIAAEANLAGFLLAPLAFYLQKHATVAELAQLEAIYHPELNSMNHALAIPARKFLQNR